MFKRNFDVIVVGAGHAGAEAAASAANLGSKVLLITQNIDTICQMSCNPAMGGVAKGQIVREIDALGGFSGIVTDQSLIQFRMLNLSKGPAMWSPRAQCDKYLFSFNWRNYLEQLTNLSLWQDEVSELILDRDRVVGVRTKAGICFQSQAVILTNGTFLNGLIHIGEVSFSGGRIGECSARNLSTYLADLGFEVGRLKTGTPVRIKGNSIDFSKLEEQKGDEHIQSFSFLHSSQRKEQRSCYLAYTNEEVHNTLRSGFEQSPMFTGRIQGRGPRYCPSIEDKIERFSEKVRHQLFVEPESWSANSYYLNGFSSSLPLPIQVEALQQIRGFENAEIIKPGYAIEYDFFPPTQLKSTLETKKVDNLYFAGQINGTTGYEEAAAQGLIAGINAHLKLSNKDAFVLDRSQAYIGVLIDDLVTKGVDEPYRMFTSRAEFRILLRQDNADQRLTALSYSIGLASEERMRRMERKSALIDTISQFIYNKSVLPEEVNTLLQLKETPIIQQQTKMIHLLLRPQVSLSELRTVVVDLDHFLSHLEGGDLVAPSAESAEIYLKYRRYIEKEQENADKIAKFETIKLKEDFDYHSLQSLSFEAREKLSKLKPETIGQASRISGVSPSDVSVLILFLGR